jgi:phosphatidate cytidylyltransferase
MKKRIISAIVALIIIVPLIILGGKYFSIGVGIISVLGLKELIDLKKSHKTYPDLIIVISYVCLLLLVYSEFDGYSIAFGLTYRGLAITLLSLLIPTVLYKDERYTTKDAFYLIACVLFLGLVFNSLILIRMLDVWHLVYLILITTMTDMFAMLLGMLVGRHKLIPHVSPNKTIEGSVLGSIVATIIASVFYITMISNTYIIKVIIITLILSIVGQFGDLLFSKIKRENEIKDFSNIMPGHGGILDRLDSLMFVILTYIILFSVI